MEYTVRELRNNILSKLNALGINPRFKENPALSSAIAEIDGFMYLFEQCDDIKVNQEDNKISFTYRDNNGNTYAYGITCHEPNEFRCVLISECTTNSSKQGTIRQRSAIEKRVSLEENNYITISTFGSTIDDRDCHFGKCNNSPWREYERYSASGIMLNKETISYGCFELEEDFSDVKVETMLYIPHKAVYAPDRNISKLQRTRTMITREYLDTAALIIEDRDKKTLYCSSVPLSQENGLRNMEVPNEYMACPREVFIPPLEKWEIDIMITSESNLKVQDGLKNLALGREGYSYSSTDNKTFERQGFESSRAKAV